MEYQGKHEAVNRQQSQAQASVLDRLIDETPGQAREAGRYRRMDLQAIMAVVVRDLENLLNSRRSIARVPAAFKAVNQSVLMYGLRDFTAENPGDPAILHLIRKDVEHAISSFEPRLRNVTVKLIAGDENERKLSFRVSGLLVVDPIREPVAFDTYFDPGRKEYVIERSDRI
jgi:type VI secretion system protein ImpF